MVMMEEKPQKVGKVSSKVIDCLEDCSRVLLFSKHCLWFNKYYEGEREEALTLIKDIADKCRELKDLLDPGMIL